MEHVFVHALQALRINRESYNRLLQRPHDNLQCVQQHSAQFATKFSPYQSHVCADVQQQANKGAKNHAVIMPDANPEATASALVGASMGAAGQRCMAISAAVFVGGIGKYKDALISKAKALKVTAGHEPGCDVGPVISPESKKRVEDLIHSATQQVGILPIAAIALSL